MKKGICLLLCVFLLAALCACSAQDPEQTEAGQVGDSLENVVIPSIEADYFALLCENCDATEYFSKGGLTQDFLLISAKDLAGQTVTICTDMGEPFEIRIVEDQMVRNETIPFHVFLAYQNLSWKEVARDETAFAEEIQTYRKQYALAAPETILYVYRLYMDPVQLGFYAINAEGKPTLKQTEGRMAVSKMTVTLDGVTKEFPVKNLECIETDHKGDLSGPLEVKTRSISGVFLPPMKKNGAMELPEVKMVAKENLVLENISFLGEEDVRLLSCELQLTPPTGGKVTLAWDGVSPIEMDKGTELELLIQISDPAMENKLTGATTKFLVVDYSSGEENHTFSVRYGLGLFSDPYEVYASTMDGVDILSYYLDYIHVTED